MQFTCTASLNISEKKFLLELSFGQLCITEWLGLELGEKFRMQRFFGTERCTLRIRMGSAVAVLGPLEPSGTGCVEHEAASYLLLQKPLLPLCYQDWELTQWSLSIPSNLGYSLILRGLRCIQLNMITRSFQGFIDQGAWILR